MLPLSGLRCALNYLVLYQINDILQSRAFLCETLPYYRAYQSGAYTTTGKVHALMLSVDSSERRYLDGEIVIARA